MGEPISADNTLEKNWSIAAAEDGVSRAERTAIINAAFDRGATDPSGYEDDMLWAGELAEIMALDVPEAEAELDAARAAYKKAFGHGPPTTQFGYFTSGLLELITLTGAKTAWDTTGEPNTFREAAATYVRAKGLQTTAQYIFEKLYAMER